MKRTLLSLICFFVFIGYGNAQYSIKGVVMDTLNSLPLCFSSVVVMRGADSTIETFGRTNAGGQVVLNVAKEGKYIVRASSSGFIDFIDKIEVKGPMTDLGTIPMVSKERVLKEFVFTRQLAAIKIKGDTTEYVADSFRTKENATVEDLLKKLPGIQVDKDGKITAQGTEVKKILVDGEEFFSDDPKVVTKGLQADALDKVQVFDKKSDQAEFTGIDDGEKTKTINLALKEDKKKGYFGKIDGGGGSDGYFQNQAMVNAFKAKRQFSAFGIMSNTDKAGLGWSDNQKFNGATNTEIMEDGMMYSYRTSDDDDAIAGWSGKYEGQGLPKTWTGGVHFADKWKEDKLHLATNYRYAMQNVEIDGQTTTNNPLFNQVAKKTQFSTGNRNGIDAMFEIKVDSLTTVKISADGGKKSMETYSQFNTVTTGTEGAALNSNTREIRSHSNSEYINSSVLVRKKFAKKGRTLSVDVKENYKDAVSNGDFNSTTLTYRSLSAPDSLITLQTKNNNSNSLSFSAKGVYTEPLSKTSFLEVNYVLTLNNSLAKNISNNTDGSIDSFYSSDYRYNISTNRGGLNYKYVKKKVTLSFGSDISDTRYEQAELLHSNNSLNTHYFNIFPSANLSYKLKKQTSINFSYQGNTRQPTINEVQTLQQNLDPINQTIGNPNLKQEFDNRFSLHFNDYKVLTSRYIWSSLNFRTASDAITTSQQITSSKNITTYTNVNGNYSADFYLGGGFKVKKPALYIGGSLGGSASHTLNYLNDTANINNNNSYNFNPYVNFEKEEKYELSWSPGFTYNDNKASISKYSTSYWTFENELSGSVQLPKKFEIGSSINFYVRQKTAVFTQNNNVTRWNAYVSKKLLKKKNLEARLSVFDILNQNIGFSRESQNGIITENRYNTIRRYGMFNLIWNFTHTPGSATATNTDNDD